AHSLSPSLRINAVPARHFSMRGLRDRNNTLWCGYVLEANAGSIYFAGDTGYGPHFQQIACKFAPVRLALLPIGAYRPTWFMSPVHISPEQAVQAAQLLGARTSIGIHFGTFALADDGELEPVERLREALRLAPGMASSFWVLDGGEGRAVPSFGVPAGSTQMPAASGWEGKQ
ncbi:MAG: MBL fold metallo-hydrolase, partial [Terriglobia bacterium]